MWVTLRYLRAVFWFAGTMLGVSGREEGNVVVVGGRGHSMTVPKGAKVDWERGVVWMVRVGENMEVGMVVEWDR